MGLATTKMLVDYCDTTLKKLGLKKERTNISATNPLILYMAKKAMQKG